MKKTLIGGGLALFVFALSVSFAFAAVNSVTPSTNDINRTKNWAHVDVVSGVGEINVNFVQPRNFYACFEYRTDGDTTEKISEVNYNTTVTDGLYPYKCLSTISNFLQTISADEYVEIRHVFGGERDERFDWTRFDVLFNRTAEITSPKEDELASGNVSFDATLTDKNGNDSVQWAVRKGTCAAGTNTVFGNVDGFSSPYTWVNGATFNATADTSAWVDGDYCFIFNPTESAGDTAIRLTRQFVVNNTPDNKDQCKETGWKSFFAPEFKNQGDCVSYIQSNEKAVGNKAK